MPSMPISTDEQLIIVDHFNTHVTFWHDIYTQANTFTGYSYRKQHEFTLTFIAENFPGNSSILDVGCGTGVTLLALAQRGYQTSGVDFASKMIQKAQDLAQEQGLSCDFSVALADQLPFPDESFEVVIALGLLPNLRDDSACLAEMRRVLRPHGTFLLSMPNVLGIDRWVGLPRSLPLILGHEFRLKSRPLGNTMRRILGLRLKEKVVRYGRSVIPARYRHHLEHQGFVGVQYHSLTFGPFVPFGLSLVSDHRSIKLSEALCRYNPLRDLGNIVIFHGHKGWL